MVIVKSCLNSGLKVNTTIGFVLRPTGRVESGLISTVNACENYVPSCTNLHESATWPIWKGAYSQPCPVWTLKGSIKNTKFFAFRNESCIYLLLQNTRACKWCVFLLKSIDCLKLGNRDFYHKVVVVLTSKPFKCVWRKYKLLTPALWCGLVAGALILAMNLFQKSIKRLQREFHTCVNNEHQATFPFICSPVWGYTHYNIHCFFFNCVSLVTSSELSLKGSVLFWNAKCITYYAINDT